jgi:hypothetical protein
MAHLSSEFGAKYDEVQTLGRRLPIQTQLRRPGQGLAANRQKMLAAGISVAWSEAEDLYYLHELSLTAAQLAVFLAQLSGRVDVSDAHLQRLTGAPHGEASRDPSRIVHAGTDLLGRAHQAV